MIKNKMRVMKGTKKTQSLIVLSGEGDTGKSTTLIKLINMLRDDGNCFYEERYGKKSKDRRVVIHFWKWYIAVCTAGDKPELIKAGLNFVRDQRCDVGIMAARPKLIDQCKKWAKFRKARFGSLRKPDVSTLYGQEMCSTLCAEVIRNAIHTCNIRDAMKCVQDADQKFATLGIS